MKPQGNLGKSDRFLVLTNIFSGINLAPRNASPELTLRELFFAKKPSNIWGELNLANLARKIFYLVQYFFVLD